MDRDPASSSSNRPEEGNGSSYPPSKASVAAIRETRRRETRELSQLNDRFASYIERVRHLEAENKKLQCDLDHLRRQWNVRTTQVKSIYEIEIQRARQTIDGTATDRASAELRAKRAEEERGQLEENYAFLIAKRDSDCQLIQRLEKQLLDNEADLSLLRRRLNDLDDEQQRSRRHSAQLRSDIQRISRDLDQETLTRVHLETQKQTLEEERHFLQQIHCEEIEECKQGLLMDTTLNPSKFFRNQLADAVKDIREEYEQLNHRQRDELQSWYQRKVSQAIGEIQSHRLVERPEISRTRDEAKKLKALLSESQQGIAQMRRRNGDLASRVRELEELIQRQREKSSRDSLDRDGQIKDLRARLNGLEHDYEQLINAKTSMDSEITVYRKLLEGEENRAGLKQTLSDIGETKMSARRSTDSSKRHCLECELHSHRTSFSSSDESTHGHHDGIPSTVDEESARVPNYDRSSAHVSDYDSSLDQDDDDDDHYSSTQGTD